MTRPVDIASISLDLDDRWAYLKAAGDASWTAYPSYLERFVPLAIDELATCGLAVTVFVVGRDAADPRHAVHLAALVEAGHEIANHSFRHDTWLHHYGTAELTDEIDRADAAIARATGRRPVGFRGPGFTWSPALFPLLADRGYRYDSTVLPTWIGPLAQRFYSRKAGVADDEMARRGAMFGRYSDVLRPNRPWRMALPEGRFLVELPVTTVPGLRTPFHMTYLLFLAERSERLMRAYLRSALAGCRLWACPPNFLLHPLDFMGADMVPELAFFPGMSLPSTRKRALVREAVAGLRGSFELGPLGARVDRLFGGGAAVTGPASAGVV